MEQKTEQRVIDLGNGSSCKAIWNEKTQEWDVIPCEPFTLSMIKFYIEEAKQRNKL